MLIVVDVAAVAAVAMLLLPAFTGNLINLADRLTSRSFKADQVQQQQQQQQRLISSSERERKTKENVKNVLFS